MKNKLDLYKLIASKKWQFGYERKMTYQKMRLFQYAYQNDIPKLFGLTFDMALYRVSDCTSSEYFLIDYYNKLVSNIESKLSDKSSTKFILRISNIIKDSYKKSVPIVDNMPISYSTYSNSDLKKSYKEFCNMEKKMSLPIWLLFMTFEDPMTCAMKKALMERFGNVEKVKEVLSTISLTSKVTPIDAYNLDLLKIALQPKSGQNKLLDKFAKKYVSWGQYDVNYEEASLDIHRENLNKLLKTDVRKSIFEIKNKYKNQIKNIKLVLKEWRSDKYISALLELYACYANYKDWKSFWREQSSHKLKFLLKEIALRTSIGESQIPFLLEHEIEDALNDKLNVSIDEIKLRMKNSAFIYIKNNLRVITNSEILNKIDSVINVRNSTITGTSAFKGKSTGIVRIVISSSDLGKVNVGDILVTSTTRPDYVPIMQKAAAFITNEGGLLSHAAIMARELKKPCIIGTKIATKVLKDGDMVEVDAEKGVVTLIKRA